MISWHQLFDKQSQWCSAGSRCPRSDPLRLQGPFRACSASSSAVTWWWSHHARMPYKMRHEPGWTSITHRPFEKCFSEIILQRRAPLAPSLRSAGEAQSPQPAFESGSRFACHHWMLWPWCGAHQQGGCCGRASCSGTNFHSRVPGQITCVGAESASCICHVQQCQRCLSHMSNGFSTHGWGLACQTAVWHSF